MNDVLLFESWSQLSSILPMFMLRCFVAAICGGIIGIERKRKAKPAGFRTNILICVGAAIYMCVGLLVVNAGGEQGDPARIAAQVVTGIGFLGAGCIIQAGGRVTGLTSAATIWVVASIGLLSGAGFPILALLSAAFVSLTLIVLTPVEQRFIDPEADDYRPKA